MRHTTQALLVAVCGVLAALTPQPLAHALPDHDSHDGGFSSQWVTERIHLNWQQEQTLWTSDDSFIGQRTVVPGDRIQRSLEVQNTSSTGATMSVRLHLRTDIPEITNNPELANDIEVFWDIGGVQASAPWSWIQENHTDDEWFEISARHVETQVAVPITIGVALAEDISDHAHLGEASTLLSFHLSVTMQGDADVPLLPDLDGGGELGVDEEEQDREIEQTPGVDEEEGRDPQDQDPAEEEPAAAAPARPTLPITGTGIIAAVLAVALSTMGFWLLLGKSRRRECCTNGLEKCCDNRSMTAPARNYEPAQMMLTLAKRCPSAPRSMGTRRTHCAAWKKAVQVQSHTP